MEDSTRFSLIYFTYFAALSGFGTFRNVYLEDIGMTGFEMGMLGAIITVFAVVAQPVWGVVTDWRGAQREILLVAAAVTAVAVLFYPLGPRFEATFLVIAFGTLLYAFFHAPITPITDSLVLSTSTFYGRVRAFGSLAFGLGSLFYGFAIAELGSSLIFYLYSVGMVALIAIAWNIPSREENPIDVVGREAVELFTSRDYILLLASAFLVGVTLLSGNDFFSVYMRDIGGTDATTGVAWFVLTLVEVAAFVYLFRFIRRYRLLLALGAFAYAAKYAVYFFVSDPTLIVASHLLTGVSFAAFYLAAVSLANALAPTALKSTAQTVLWSATFGIGAGVGHLLAGHLHDAVGVQAMYGYLAVIGAAGGLVALLIRSDAAGVSEESEALVSRG